MSEGYASQLAPAENFYRYCRLGDRYNSCGWRDLRRHCHFTCADLFRDNLIGNPIGAFLGSFFIIGLPELLPGFSEYRFMVVGAVMVTLMRYKLEGVWHEESRKLELHEGEEQLGEILDEEFAPAGSSTAHQEIKWPF